ncbi:MAG TPA: DoxX family protein [Gemmataceae bacterium]|nr:DoxX family protein [Gemmataceae bacterium]
MSIGCHLLYEGIWKINQKDTWSSKSYIRGATGPFGMPVRWLAGDPDVAWKDGHYVDQDPSADIRARFTIIPFDANEASENRRPHQHLPPPLAKEWDDYLDRFINHYKLGEAEKIPPETLGMVMGSPQASFPAFLSWGSLFFYSQKDPAAPVEPRVQKILAEVKFILAKNDTVNWLVKETTKVKLSLVSPGEVPKTIAVRLNDYEEKIREARDIETSELQIFGSRNSEKLKKTRQEAALLKKSLQDNLDSQTAKMKGALREVLTYEQRRLASVPEPAATLPPTWSRLKWIDAIVKYGLTAVGVGLLIGLFTRLSCLGGVLLLLMFYLAMPPWPGLGEGMAKGHYLFINENIIEALALLVIAFSKPARRYGLDAWMPSIRRRNRRTRQIFLENSSHGTGSYS